MQEDADIAAAAFIGHVEEQAMYKVLEKFDANVDSTQHCNTIPKEADEIATVLSSVNALLTDASLYDKLSSRNELSQF